MPTYTAVLNTADSGNQLRFPARSLPTWARVDSLPISASTGNTINVHRIVADDGEFAAFSGNGTLFVRSASTGELVESVTASFNVDKYTFTLGSDYTSFAGGSVYCEVKDESTPDPAQGFFVVDVQDIGVTTLDLFVDAGGRTFIDSVGFGTELGSLDLIARSVLNVRIRFVVGRTIQELGTPNTITLTIKSEGNFEGVPLAQVTTFTKVGVNEDSFYQGTLSLTGAELLGALQQNDSIACMTEVEWEVNGFKSMTSALPTTITNNVNQ